MERKLKVWLGRTMVTGKPVFRYSRINKSSMAALFREYSQWGLCRGVASVMTGLDRGFW